MPYEILEISPRRFRVSNTRTGKVYAKRTTEARARSQLRILRQHELRQRVRGDVLDPTLERKFLDTWWCLSSGTFLKSHNYHRGRGLLMIRHLLAHNVHLFNSIATRLNV